MNLMISSAFILHLLAAALWVGGMFFAHQALRPAAISVLEPPERLMLWSRTFARFFPWVWIFVTLLPVSGYWMVFQLYGGLGGAGLHIHLMQGLGIPMILIFMHLFFAPYRRLNRCVAIQDWQAAAENLATIRKMIGINLLLGLAVIAIAATGRFGSAL